MLVLKINMFYGDMTMKHKNKRKLESKDNVLAVFLHLIMPVMDGFSVLDYLSSDNYLSKILAISLIIVSSSIDTVSSNSSSTAASFSSATFAAAS